MLESRSTQPVAAVEIDASHVRTTGSEARLDAVSRRDTSSRSVGVRAAASAACVASAGSEFPRKVGSLSKWAGAISVGIELPEAAGAGAAVPAPASADAWTTGSAAEGAARVGLRRTSWRMKVPMRTVTSAKSADMRRRDAGRSSNCSPSLRMMSGTGALCGAVNPSSRCPAIWLMSSLGPPDLAYSLRPVITLRRPCTVTP